MIKLSQNRFPSMNEEVTHRLFSSTLKKAIFFLDRY